MTNPRPTRYVVFHRPGPRWKPGIDFREQEGIEQHVRHYLKLHEQGKLELGGPFLLQDAAGMMVARRMSHLRSWKHSPQPIRLYNQAC